MISIQSIASYWDKQAVIWREEKQEAWTLPETEHWSAYFRALRPKLSGNKVLEVGTASGYFANILSLAGYEVTAVDLSEAMIEEAKKVSAQFDIPVDYHIMNAQNIQFHDETFDLIFTRLMTWTLPDVPQFYKSCFKILKPGGTLLNFDGDFGNVIFSQEGHERYPDDVMEEANTIKAQLEISKQKRPERDIELLREIGFKNVDADLWAQNEILHLPEGEPSLFRLRGIKP